MRKYSIHTRFLVSLTGLLIAASSVFALNFGISTANAAIDNTPDCDTVAIIKCGAFSESALKAAYDKNSTGDLKQVYNAFGISRSDMTGFSNGIVYRNGKVTVDGKVVATNAMTAGRNYGGTPIPGTKNVGKYSVSKFVDEGQTAFVKMVNGKFSFAIVKACSNPVSATPTKPAPKPTPTPPAPTPQPTPKPTPKPTPTPPAPSQVKVCNPANGQTITVSENDQSKYKPVGDVACTDIQVCKISTKQTVTIRESEFDSNTYSKDMSTCQVAAPSQPLPSTGPTEFLTGSLGVGSLTAAGYYFRSSRRYLISKFLNR